MSWDVLLCKFSRKYTHVDQMAKDEKFLVLGVRDEIQAIISSIFPGTDWNDSSWGHYSGNYGSFEFNLGDNDPTTSLFLHIRCLLYTSPSPRDKRQSRMPSSA